MKVTRRMTFLIGLIVAMLVATLGYFLVAVPIDKPLKSSGLAVAQKNKSFNDIVAENNLPGTTSWKLKKPANGRIQGYASADSVNRGGTIQLMISTQRPNDPYNIKIFRLGWYHGAGGRLMVQTPTMLGQAQGWWNAQTGRHDLPSPNAQGLLSLHWKASYDLKVPPHWVSGYYIALLTDKAGYQSYIPFIVRDDDTPHAILVESPVNTAQAYNAWGDYSFYGHYSNEISDCQTVKSSTEEQDDIVTVPKGMRTFVEFHGNNAEEVSFNRPYAEDNGAGLTFLEFPTVYWLESQGYDLSYTTSVAMDMNTCKWVPRVFISIGHDEYWTSTMRNYVDNLLYHGVSAAFFGANDIYWKVRYADNHRTLIGYRWEPQSDPMRGTPDQTGAWRNLGDPESNLLGEQYYGQSVTDPMWVVSDSKSWVFRGLHVHDGEKVPGIMGWEFDSTEGLLHRKAGLVVIAKSPYKDIVHKKMAYAESTLYQLHSGAYVFDAGTIWWGYGLSNPVGYKILNGIANIQKDTRPGNPIIQGVTRNLLDQMLQSSGTKTLTLYEKLRDRMETH